MIVCSVFRIVFRLAGRESNLGHAASIPPFTFCRATGNFLYCTARYTTKANRAPTLYMSPSSEFGTCWKCSVLVGEQFRRRFRPSTRSRHRISHESPCPQTKCQRDVTVVFICFCMSPQQNHWSATVTKASHTDHHASDEPSFLRDTA